MIHIKHISSNRRFYTHTHTLADADWMRCENKWQPISSEHTCSIESAMKSKQVFIVYALHTNLMVLIADVGMKEPPDTHKHTHTKPKIDKTKEEAMCPNVVRMRMRRKISPSALREQQKISLLTYTFDLICLPN